MSNFPTPAISWSDVARVCRRVCVLRERGLSEEAERLRAGELMRLIAAVRAPTESEAAITERLNALFAVESERVANAAVLAEILAPLLSEKTHTPVASVASTQPDPLPATTTPPAAAPPKPRRGSIADFIDDMIAQEMPPERDGPGNQRRAS